MKLRLFLKAYDNQLLNLTCLDLRKKLKFIDNECSMTGVISLPIKKKVFCVLRSPHVDKDSREHFEIRFSKCFFDLELNSSSIIKFLLKVELPSGIFISFKYNENK